LCGISCDAVLGGPVGGQWGDSGAAAPEEMAFARQNIQDEGPTSRGGQIE